MFQIRRSPVCSATSGWLVLIAFGVALLISLAACQKVGESSPAVSNDGGVVTPASNTASRGNVQVSEGSYQQGTTGSLGGSGQPGGSQDQSGSDRTSRSAARIFGIGGNGGDGGNGGNGADASAPGAPGGDGGDGGEGGNAGKNGNDLDK